MAKTVDLQIRKMPAVLRDRLRVRARGKGKTMSQYVIDILSDDLERPTIDEWLDELLQVPDVRLPPDFSAADLIREVREERERELGERVARSLARRRDSAE